MRKGLIQVPLKFASGFADFNVVERYNPTLHCQHATQWQLFSITYIFWRNVLEELKIISETFKYQDLV